MGAAYASLTSDLPAVSRLPELLDPNNGPLNQPTRLYDRSGTQLIYSLENPGIPRRYVYLDPNRENHFSPELVRVTVGILDPNFWQNPGFRLDSLTSPQPDTIAERLALDLLLSQEAPGPRRAVRMRLLAAQMIHSYGRTQVLEWYLNSAYFGSMAYGADAASRLYLNQPASSLDLAGSALLMAVHLAPALNPLDAPQAALERQSVVLEQLQEAEIVNKEEAARARAVELHFAAKVTESASPALAFSQMVIDQLSARFGKGRLERGGLRIITTLDYNLQIELNCLTRVQLLRLTGKDFTGEVLPDGKPCQSARLLPSLPPGAEALPDSLATSAVVIDPQTGEVLALIGDTTVHGEGQKILPHAPGSLLSPLVAVAGFARGYSPASMVWDIPSSLPAGMAEYQNPDGKFHGPVRLRTALANDYLVPVAQILDQIGAQNVWQMARTLGVPDLSGGVAQDGPQASLLFYGGSVSPVDMAQAYAIFAAKGVKHGQSLANGSIKPNTALYVEELALGEDANNALTLLDARQPQSQIVLSEPLAFLIHHVLSDATARWPSLGYPNALEIGRPAGAQVGRIAGEQQAWAAGYTPQRVALFWLGLPDSTDSQQTVDPRLAAGSWHALMQFVNASLPAQDWSEPLGITHLDVCDPSGQLPTSACPNVVSEVFLAGTEPNTYDSLYRVFQINRETGHLATVFTPPALVEEKTYLVVPSEARSWLQLAGLPMPPEDYDAIQAAAASDTVRIDSPQSFAYVGGEVEIQGTASGEAFDFYQVQAGQGLNPRDWLQILSDGRTQVRNGELGVWNTAGLEGLYAIRLMVVRQDQSVETSVIQVTVDNTAPLARVVYPSPEQSIDTVSEKTITFQAEAEDAVGIRRVVWLVDGKQVGDSIQAPYVFTWKPIMGKHTLSIVAYDLAGNPGRSDSVSFSVK